MCKAIYNIMPVKNIAATCGLSRSHLIQPTKMKRCFYKKTKKENRKTDDGKTQTRDERGGWRDLVPFRFVSFGCLDFLGSEARARRREGEERDNGGLRACAPVLASPPFFSQRHLPFSAKKANRRPESLKVKSCHAPEATPLVRGTIMKKHKNNSYT